MKLLVLADIHAHTEIIDKLSNEFRNADVVLIAGDLTSFDESSVAADLINRIRKYNQNVYAVHGNCDTHETAKYLEDQGISLHQNFIEHHNMYFTGLGGVLPTRARLSSVYNSFETFVDCAMNQNGNKVPIIFVTHQPALETKVDLADSGHHGGSMSIRNIIEKLEPILAISGHIHEARGTDTIGNTVLVNPGPLKNGCYAKIDIDEETRQVVSVELLQAHKNRL